MIALLSILSALKRFFYALILWVLDNKRWAVIVILGLCVIFQAWNTYHLNTKLAQANAVCEKSKKTAVDKALQPYLDSAKKAQENAQKAGESYEKSKKAERVKTETITRTVQKIVERPIYINTCFDSDGVSAVNAAGNTSKS